MRKAHLRFCVCFSFCSLQSALCSLWWLERQISIKVTTQSSFLAKFSSFPLNAEMMMSMPCSLSYSPILRNETTTTQGNRQQQEQELCRKAGMKMMMVVALMREKEEKENRGFMWWPFLFLPSLFLFLFSSLIVSQSGEWSMKNTLQLLSRLSKCVRTKGLSCEDEEEGILTALFHSSSLFAVVVRQVSQYGLLKMWVGDGG